MKTLINFFTGIGKKYDLKEIERKLNAPVKVKHLYVKNKTPFAIKLDYMPNRFFSSDESYTTISIRKI